MLVKAQLISRSDGVLLSDDPCVCLSKSVILDRSSAHGALKLASKGIVDTLRVEDVPSLTVKHRSWVFFAEFVQTNGTGDLVLRITIDLSNDLSERSTLQVSHGFSAHLLIAVLVVVGYIIDEHLEAVHYHHKEEKEAVLCTEVE